MDDLKLTTKNRFRIAETCPCEEARSNKDGKFVPFDGFTDKGYCHSCGDWFLPDKENKRPVNNHRHQKTEQPRYVSKEFLDQSLKGYGNNIFYQYMEKKIGVLAAREIRERYKLGTAKNGGVIFWLIDINGNIRQPKAMQYNKEGHKIKTHVPTGYTRDNGFRPCLFGEHLLKDKNKPVALVESEKTACLGSFKFPRFTWLASGGGNGLTTEKAAALKGFKVLIIP